MTFKHFFVNLFSQKNKKMPTIQELIQLLEARNQTIDEQNSRISELEAKLEKKQQENNNLKRILYGRKSEKMKTPEASPLPLFPNYDSGIEVIDNTSLNLKPSEVIDAIEEESRQRREREKSQKKNKQKKERRIARISSYANLERVVAEVYPEGYDKETMEIIGSDSTVTLEEQKHKLYLKEEIRYICVKKSDAKDLHPQILQQPLTPRICEEGYLGNSIIASILVNKFCHHLPEYRQIKMYKEYGVDIPASTMNRAQHMATDALYPLYYAQMKAVLESSYIHMDETTLPINDHKNNTRKGYIWSVVDGNSQSKGLFFYYRGGSRSQDVMNLILNGYEGAVQVDGYKAYEALKNLSSINLLYCMAHTRRKFESIKDKYPDDIPHILKYFSLLYQVEANLKERNAGSEEIKTERLTKSVPILKCMKQWMEQKQKECTPKSGLGEAISYALTRWEGLCRYVSNGIYNIDNNPVERSIRPMALGRKNWLFIKNDNSGEDLAVIRTLIGSCELLGVNPRDWLNDVFSKIAGKQEYDAMTLLPFNYINNNKR